MTQSPGVWREFAQFNLKGLRCSEVSVFVALDFNAENNTTNYTSGDVLHIDLTEQPAKLETNVAPKSYGQVAEGAKKLHLLR